LEVSCRKPERESAQRLYEQIGSHLLRDDAPSNYLDLVSRQPEFRQYPFTMLLKLQATGQSPIHHPEGTVWNHTMLVVDEAAKRKSQSRDASAFMWAALLHDIGKPLTTRCRNGRITAYRHDTVGEKLTEDFLSALTADRSLIEKVSALVRFHMHILYVTHNLPFADIGEMKRRTDLREVGLLGLCDRMGRGGASQAEEAAQTAFFIRQCEQSQLETHIDGDPG